jgi:anti-sigma-K factor RskA
VSGCRTHHELVGGYLLGALEPAEMEEMRSHVATCPHCARESRELAALPGLLDAIEPADVPPPQLRPEVEEAVLDRFAQEHKRPPAPRSRRFTRPVLAFAAVCAAALALVLVLLLPLGGDDGDGAYASASLAGLEPTSKAKAYAKVTYVPAGTRVELSAHGLPRGGGGVYELWCIRDDGRWVSGGTFHAGSDGDANAELTAAVWPGDYKRMVVTRRPDSRVGSERGTAVLRGKLRY